MKNGKATVEPQRCPALSDASSQITDALLEQAIIMSCHASPVADLKHTHTHNVTHHQQQQQQLSSLAHLFHTTYGRLIVIKVAN